MAVAKTPDLHHIDSEREKEGEYLKKELPYFTIEGASGGNQNWFLDPMMRLGGCAAVTACDSCIYFALRGGRTRLCPLDVHRISKKDYVGFAMKMKPYLRPRRQGVNTLSLYKDGYQAYLRDAGETGLSMEEFPGGRPAAQAEKAVRRQIDRGYPVPVLLLKHKNPALNDFVWHWFLLAGYEEREGFYVKAATYGKFFWISFPELWDTGYEEKGGLILYSLHR